MRGAAALLHDARFDPHERLDLLERERVNVLCMAPTEYRVIAARAEPRPVASLRGLVAAGEALNPEVLRAFREATGLWIRDGYGQTETGQTTGQPAGRDPKPGSMGPPLPGVRLRIDDGELCLDPATRPDVLPRLPRRGRAPRPRRRLGGRADRRDGGTWRTGDRVTQDEDGYLHFEGRADDVIISRRLPDRPVRGRVRARLAPRGRGGGGRRRARRRARLGRARDRRAARRATRRRRRSPRAAGPRQARRPRPTSTRGSWSSPTSCRRRRAARCAARCCATGHERAGGPARRGGREVATYLPGTRDGLPLADEPHRGPRRALEDVAAIACALPARACRRGAGAAGDLLLAGGATLRRRSTLMTCDPAAPREPVVTPEGVLIGPAAAPARRPARRLHRRLPPGHPDHRAGWAARAAEELLRS